MPALISRKGSSGFSMVEVMMAILILMVGMLGLLQSINLALEVNTRNQVREEAVNIGQKVMNEFRGKGFDNISVPSVTTDPYKFADYQVPSKLRGAARTFTVSRKSTVLSTEDGLPVNKQLEVTVKWEFKGVEYENRVVAPISIRR